MEPIDFTTTKMPRYEQIRQQLRAQIAGSTWDIRTPLPSEVQLAKDYSVSIGTIRKAVDLLIEEGIVERRQGAGTYLRHPDFSQSPMRFFRYQSTAAAGAVPAGEVQRIEERPADYAINQTLGLAPNAHLIYLERLRKNPAGEVMLSEKIWLPKRLFAPLLQLQPADFDNLLYPMYLRLCGQFIASAQETLTITAGAADPYLSAENTTLVRIERIAKNPLGKPLEYRISCGLPEHFCYQTTIS